MIYLLPFLRYLYHIYIQLQLLLVPFQALLILLHFGMMMAIYLSTTNMKIHHFPVAKGDYQLQHRNAERQFSDGQCTMGSWKEGFLLARWESRGNAQGMT